MTVFPRALPLIHFSCSSLHHLFGALTHSVRMWLTIMRSIYLFSFSCLLFLSPLSWAQSTNILDISRWVYLHFNATPETNRFQTQFIKRAPYPLSISILSDQHQNILSHWSQKAGSHHWFLFFYSSSTSNRWPNIINSASSLSLLVFTFYFRWH